LHQKLANLNAALGFGRNDQRGAATSKSRKDKSVCRNVHISISASWFVGELSGYPRYDYFSNPSKNGEIAIKMIWWQLSFSWAGQSTVINVDKVGNIV